MHIKILMVSNKPPAWISTGFEEYCKRLKPQAKLELQLLSPAPYHTREQILQHESIHILKRITSQDYLVALAVNGQAWDNKILASKVSEWQSLKRPLVFLIGGAEGLSNECVTQAHACWSLSHLVFPHAFVPLLVAEQLYRSFSILSNHPYHRG